MNMYDCLSVVGFSFLFPSTFFSLHYYQIITSALWSDFGEFMCSRKFYMVAKLFTRLHMDKSLKLLMYASYIEMEQLEVLAFCISIQDFQVFFQHSNFQYIWNMNVIGIKFLSKFYSKCNRYYNISTYEKVGGMKNGIAARIMVEHGVRTSNNSMVNLVQWLTGTRIY